MAPTPREDDAAAPPAMPAFARQVMVFGDHSARQIATLSFIATHPGLSTAAVARSLGLSKPAITRAIDRLVAERLAASEEDPSDRRRVRLTATARGAAMLAQAEGRADA